VLDRDELLAVQDRQEENARVYRAISHSLAMQRSQDDRACSTVTFGATLFGADQVLDRAQVFEHGHGRIQAGQLSDPIVQHESYAICHVLRLEGLWHSVEVRPI
jgi:hypothetical protein